jgi:Protein of unknown function (DUF1592)/Protein of unknown function (DUF1588)/Protein of unknown function (DUF1595)/Protein of unknown function (DUF1587)/Protein of unknown function (DUF1585)
MVSITRRVGFTSIVSLCLATLACESSNPSNSTATSGTAGNGAATAGAGSLAGSAGAAGTAAGTGGAPLECANGVSPGRTPLRRLTAGEYNNSVRDLLGDTTGPGADFPPPAEGSGYSNDADAYQTQQVDVQAWLTAAQKLAASYRSSGKLKLTCAADAVSCATGFIKDMGRKLFRRPVTDAEVTSYLARFTAGTMGGSFEEGLEWVLERMLQSPHFLYRVETESASQPAGTAVPLSDYSIATRLSYFLWATTPNDELLAAAEAKQLSTPEGVAEQVKTMMKAEAFKSALSFFHQQWIQWNKVEGSQKATVITPAWDGALQRALRHESELFVEDIFLNGGTFKDMLTASHTFLNPTLAAFYGVPYPGNGTDFVRVELPHRAGLLTHASVMAGLSAPNQSHPVRRGHMVRQRLLCFEPPPPPNGLKVELPAVVPGETTRQRFERHRTRDDCKTCHVFLDPLGVPLENYDEFGRYRDMDQGLPVDATGGLTMVASKGSVADPALAPVSGALDLGTQLADLPEAQRCLVQNWFRYAAGHEEEAADTCTLSSLIERLNASGGKLDDLLIGIATSDGFRYRMDVP